jgi:hypothetical protein
MVAVPAGTVIHVSGLPFLAQDDLYIAGLPGNAKMAGLPLAYEA